MGFMEPQITDKERWAEVDTNCGMEWIPIEQLGITLPEWEEDEQIYLTGCQGALSDWLEGSRIFSIQERMGYGARLSAPGYMDCTEWTVFDTEQEARDYLEETYGDESEEEESV